MNELAWLRIKIKTLAVEAQFNRREYDRALKCARWERTRPEPSPSEVHRLDLLAAQTLHHKRKVIRPIQRASLLAYAFLRGKEYASVEPTARTEPNWKAVEDMVKAHATGASHNKTLDEFFKWQAEARSRIAELKTKHDQLVRQHKEDPQRQHQPGTHRSRPGAHSPAVANA